MGKVQPEIAEVIGIKEALSWIEGREWPPMIIEMDLLVCVQAENNKFHMTYEFRLLVQDGTGLLSNANNVIFKFVKRSVNKAALFLARSSCFSPGVEFRMLMYFLDYIRL